MYIEERFYSVRNNLYKFSKSLGYKNILKYQWFDYIFKISNLNMGKIFYY